MANTPGYFKEYYEKNKTRFNRKRKIRYSMDEEYRERVLLASREYRSRKRIEDKKDDLVKVPRFQSPLVYELDDGGKIELYSIGYFSHFLGRSVQSIVHWESTKPHPILPVTPYRDVRKFRYYTAYMMTVVVDVVGERKRLFSSDKGMYEKMYNQIFRRWKRAGVPVDRRIIKFTKNTLQLALRDTKLRTD